MQTLSGHAFGRYHLLEPLGEGGMATVYRGFDTRLERPVAIKVIRTDYDRDPAFLKRFEREARALAQLNHPNIVKVLDVGDQDGVPYVVMEFLGGGTLKARTGRPLAPFEAARLLLPIARALAYAHDLGIVHRDVKPANILLTERGEPSLSDFGIAKILERKETTELTATGMGVGTPDYMAPEQWQGNASPQSDIYALGVVLYELLTGRRPYIADTPIAVLLKHINDPLPDPRQFAPDLPDVVQQVLVKALAKKPEDRYTSMAEFAAALERVSHSEQARRPHLHPLAGIGLAVGGVAVAGLICVGAAAAALLNRQGTQPTPAAAHTPTTVALAPPTTTAATLTRTPLPPTPEPALTPTEAPIEQAVAAGQVVYYSARDGNHEIYAMAADGSGQINLTWNLAADWLPAYSPDGAHIAFVSDRDGDVEIYIMDADGRAPTRLTIDPANDEAPSFAPDGGRIAFQSNRGGTIQIYVMNLDGTDVRQLTADTADSGLPKWSPDGSRIAFQSKRDGDWDVYVMNADGSNVRNLTNNIYVDVAPDWSPDGTRIVFSSNRDADHYEIYTMTAEGHEAYRVTHGTANSWTPAWSADGVFLYYATKIGDTYEIARVRPDGTDTQRLTQNNGHDQAPDSQPIRP